MFLTQGGRKLHVVYLRLKKNLWDDVTVPISLLPLHEKPIALKERICEIASNMFSGFEGKMQVRTSYRAYLYTVCLLLRVGNHTPITLLYS
jgi:hypothetical protein